MFDDRIDHRWLTQALTCAKCALALVATCIVSSCGFDAIQVVDVTFQGSSSRKYAKDFVLCLDRPLERGESYNFEMTIKTKSGRTQACHGLVANNLGLNPPRCEPMNLFVYCLNRRSTAVERGMIDELNPGAVQSVTVRLSEDSPRRTIGEWTFGPR
jgi:hypothetical protein